MTSQAPQDRSRLDAAPVEPRRRPARASARSRRTFVWRRLHSLSGVVPLAVFVVVHLAVQSSALDGPDAHAAAMATFSRFDAHPGWAVVAVLAPLCLHALGGLYLTTKARPRLGVYQGGHHWRYVVQRVSGLVTLAYLAVHLRETWIPRALGEAATSDAYALLVEALSTTVAGGVPLRAAFELVGLAAVSFHLASGLWGFSCAWGLTTSRRAQRRSAVVCGVLGVALFGYAANLAFHLSTGARLVEASPALDGARSAPLDPGVA